MSGQNITGDQIYYEKDDPWSSHSIIYRWLVDFSAGTRVLDVGAAAGTLGKKCEGLGFEIRGLEPVSSWADIARPNYTEILISKIEEAPISFLENHDIVVCADILEHLPNPDTQLDRLVRLQKTGSSFIISVPNVANIWVRLNLLIGKFDYTEKGILDRTHLRFFTRKSLLSFLKAAGLDVKEIKYSPIPLNLVNSFFDRSSIGRFVFRLLNGVTQLIPTLLAYQFIVIAKTRNQGSDIEH